jgi:hypothetical protein
MVINDKHRKRETPRRFTQQERESILVAFKTSGMTKVDWCKQHGICLHTINNWLYDKTGKYNSQTLKPINWVPLKISQPLPNPEFPSLRIEMYGLSILVEPGTSPEHLQMVLKAVNSL